MTAIATTDTATQTAKAKYRWIVLALIVVVYMLAAADRANIGTLQQAFACSSRRMRSASRRSCCRPPADAQPQSAFDHHVKKLQSSVVMALPASCRRASAPMMHYPVRCSGYEISLVGCSVSIAQRPR